MATDWLNTDVVVSSMLGRDNEKSSGRRWFDELEAKLVDEKENWAGSTVMELLLGKLDAGPCKLLIEKMLCVVGLLITEIGSEDVRSAAETEFDRLEEERMLCVARPVESVGLRGSKLEVDSDSDVELELMSIGNDSGVDFEVDLDLVDWEVFPRKVNELRPEEDRVAVGVLLGRILLKSPCTQLD